jgi:hypothetical protein
MKEGSYLFGHISAWEGHEREDEGALPLVKVNYTDDDIFVTSKIIFGMLTHCYAMTMRQIARQWSLLGNGT